MSLSTFNSWLKREETPKGFVELSLPRTGGEAPIEVLLPNGIQIKVRTTGDLTRTAQLIRRVTGVQSC